MSYNNISPADVLALGCLKRLRELDISANNLASLPADISVDVGSSAARCVQFVPVNTLLFRRTARLYIVFNCVSVMLERGWRGCYGDGFLPSVNLCGSVA